MTPRTLYLVRGLPGSGKSTLAATLAPGHAYAADDLFVGEDGIYRFDPKRLPEAHADCQARTSAALSTGASVAVANTFTEAWEVEPYRAIARAAGARLVVLSMFDGELDDSALAARNVHGVPMERIAGMRARYDHTLTGDPRPPWERT